MARRLKNMGDLRRYVANIINRVEAGQLEPSVAGRLGFLVNILVRIVETGDLEMRVEVLEQKIEQSK